MQHSQPTPELSTTAKPWRIGLIGTRYYIEHIDEMLKSATGTLTTHGVDEANITTAYAYGSWEVPLLGSTLAKEGKVDALIGFGIIVQGETYHDQHLARESARAMMDIQLQYGIPFGYELLHIKETAQLSSRISGINCKGKEAALSILNSLEQLQALKG